MSYLLCLDLNILKGNVVMDSLILSVRKYAPTTPLLIEYVAELYTGLDRNAETDEEDSQQS